jgi:hypothetical protein
VEAVAVLVNEREISGVCRVAGDGEVGSVAKSDSRDAGWRNECRTRVGSGGAERERSLSTN